MKRLVATLDSDEQYRQLQGRLRTEGRTVSQWVREQVKIYLDEVDESRPGS